MFFITNSFVFAQKPRKFSTLNPGHFHSSLVLNNIYENINLNANANAQLEQYLQDRLKRNLIMRRVKANIAFRRLTIRFTEIGAEKLFKLSFYKFLKNVFDSISIIFVNF